MTTSALVLAAGRGSRMRAAANGAALAPEQAAAADAGHKGMMPIAGRPFLDHALHSLADAGFTNIGLVLAPHHDDMREYYRTLPVSRITIALLMQAEPLGTADAVCAGETWASREPFVVLNGDNLYPVAVLSRLRDARGPAVPGFARDSLGLPLDRVGAFALLEADARGCLARIVEKPGFETIAAAGPDALISMNVWRFDARIFDACRDVPVSARGERELPEAVEIAASRGMCVEVLPVRGEVLDLSSRADVACVARRLDEAPVQL